jgi:hypothetical protein
MEIMIDVPTAFAKVTANVNIVTFNIEHWKLHFLVGVGETRILPR